VKPILKWAGGKSKLAPAICDAFGGDCRGVYYEPFVGSAAVFLFRRSRGQIRKAVLSDVNVKLMAFHRAVRDQVDEVVKELARLPQTDWRERYYDVRDAYNDGPWDGPAHAARFVWINRACFNGLYRENRDGGYNVPRGSYAKLKLPEPSVFWQVSQLLQGVELRDSAFGAVLEAAGPDDHVYCDPPYVPLTATANFTAYCREPFGHDEQVALAAHARSAAGRGARVVLSNHDVPMVRECYYDEALGFELTRKNVARAISRNAHDRKAAPEVIARIGPSPVLRVRAS
jgi:DNA adenine methylase